MNRALPQRAIATRHQGGSLLFEVMIALAIFACGIVGLAMCLDKTIETVNSIRKETQIRQELQTRLDDLRQGRLAVGAKDEDPDANGVKYSHEITALQIQSDRKTLLNNLYDVKVTAKWLDGTVEQERTSEIYVYQP